MVVTWLGGPLDGMEFEVAGAAPFELSFLDEECYDMHSIGDKLTFHYRTFVPQLVGGRWMVPWTEY